MCRDLIDSIIIGYLLTYLPIFDFYSDRLGGAVCFAALIFISILSTKNEPGEAPHRLKIVKIGNKTYLYTNTDRKKIKVEKLQGGGTKWTI